MFFLCFLDPILLDADMEIAAVDWNSHGSILTVLGKKNIAQKTSKILYFIQFFDCWGHVS